MDDIMNLTVDEQIFRLKRLTTEPSAVLILSDKFLDTVLKAPQEEGSGKTFEDFCRTMFEILAREDDEWRMKLQRETYG